MNRRERKRKAASQKHIQKQIKAYKAKSLQAKDIIKELKSDSNEVGFYLHYLRLSKSLPVDQIQNVLDWLSRSKLKDLMEPCFPATYAQLISKHVPFSANNLVDQIGWTTCLLAQNSEKLNRFLDCKARFESYLLLAEFEAAEQELTAINQLFGYSLWLKESSLLLSELSGGFEKNRQTLLATQSELGETIPGILSHYFSVRAEQKITIANYRQIIKGFVASVLELGKKSEREASDKVRHAISYKLLSEHIVFKLAYFDYHGDTNSLQYILQEEESSSIIDLYISYVKVLHFIAAKKEHELLQTHLQSVVAFICTQITDPRLHNLDHYWRPERALPRSTARDELVKLADYYTRGEYETAASIAQEAVRHSPGCLEHHELLVRSLIHGSLELHSCSSASDSVSDRITENLFNILKKNDKTQESLNDILRLAYVLESTRLGSQLFSIWQEHTANRSHLDIRVLRALNAVAPSASSTLAYDSAQKAALLIQRLRGAYRSSPSVELFETIVKQSLRKEAKQIELNIPMARKLKYHSHMLEHCEKYEQAVPGYLALQEQSLSIPPYQRDAAMGLYRCYLSLNKLTRCLDLVLNTHYLCEELLSPHHLVHLINAYNAKESGYGVHQIGWSLFFHIYFSRNYLPYDYRKLFVLYAGFLSSEGVQRPTQLQNLEQKWGIKRAVHFLRSICVLEVMDSSVCFESTEDLEDERVNICSLLRILDPGNETHYADEISRLTQGKAIRRAIHDVGYSKVYVDTANIRRTLDRTFSENFDRYKRISMLDPQLRKTLKTLSRSTNSPVVFIVGDEGSTLFGHLFNDIKTRYISSNEYGLDSYLSVRIRHGVLSGQLRRGFEELHLITRKDTTNGIYQPNSHWRNHFLSHGISVADACDAELKLFSSSIDEIIDMVKDDWIQIRSNSHPHGYFDFGYSLLELQKLYLKLSDATDLDNFLDELFEELRSRTESNLARIRNSVQNKLKDLFILAIGDMEAKIASLLNGARHTAFRTAIAQCTTTIQRELNTLASWFNNVDERAMADFEFGHLIATSIEVIKALYPSVVFIPNQNVEFKGPIKGSKFAYFFDLIFILLDNSLKHGLPPFPVDILVAGSGNVLSIEVSNKIEESSYEELRTLIVVLEQRANLSEAVEETRTEGGSGFYKLGRILRANLERQQASVKIALQEE